MTGSASIGDAPSRHDKRDLRSALDARMGEGLAPLRLGPDETEEGLRAISFSAGLDELTVDRLRAAQVASAKEAEGDALDKMRAAARRARHLDMDL